MQSLYRTHVTVTERSTYRVDVVASSEDEAMVITQAYVDEIGYAQVGEHVSAEIVGVAVDRRAEAITGLTDEQAEDRRGYEPDLPRFTVQWEILDARNQVQVRGWPQQVPARTEDEAHDRLASHVIRQYHQGNSPGWRVEITTCPSTDSTDSTDSTEENR